MYAEGFKPSPALGATVYTQVRVRGFGKVAHRVN